MGEDIHNDPGKRGVIIEDSRQPDSYWVDVDGKVWRRNRAHCRKLYGSGLQRDKYQELCKKCSDGKMEDKDIGTNHDYQTYTERSDIEGSDGEHEENDAESEEESEEESDESEEVSDSEEGSEEETEGEEANNERRGAIATEDNKKVQVEEEPYKTRSGRPVSKKHLAKDYKY